VPLVVVSSPLCKPRDPQGERIARVMRDAAPSDSGGRAERQCRAARSSSAVSEPHVPSSASRSSSASAA